MKDGSNASTNAAMALVDWGDKVQDHMCNTHTHIRWFPAHKQFFRCAQSKVIAGATKQKKKRGTKSAVARGSMTKKEEKQQDSLGKMYRDLKLLRTFPLVGLVKHSIKLMLDKWKAPVSRGGYGEVAIAEKWEESWAHTRMTRIERNHDHVLKGGLPCDNNTTERLNRSDKKVICEIAGPSRSTSLEAFLSAVLTRMSRLSRQDLSFCGKLKHPVRSTRFHSRVDAIWKKYEQNTKLKGPSDSYKPCCLELQFGCSHAASGFAPGTILMISGTGIDELTLFFEGETKLRSCRDWRNGIRFPLSGAQDGECWLKTLKAYVTNPEVVESVVDDFDQLNRQSRMFVMCSPIDPSSDSDSRAAVQVIHDLLLREGIPIEPLEKLISRGRKGLVTCNCGVYLHYVWCKHAYAIALQRGIIGFPFYPEFRNPRNKDSFQTKKNISAMRPFVGTGGRSVALRKDSSSDDDINETDASEAMSILDDSDLEDDLDYFTDDDREVPSDAATI